MTQQFLSGWRPSLPDIRDKKFKAIQANPLPPSIDLSTSPAAPFSSIWDQGALGSCGPNTLAELVTYDEELGGAGVVPSRLFLYYNTRLLMNTVASDSGVDNRTMLKALAQYGYCDESLWPYNVATFTQRPSQQAFLAAEKTIPNIVYQGVNQSAMDMKSCLVELKRPFIYGFTVYESMLSAQVAQTGIVPMPGGIMDGVAGGHDVLIVGYDDATQMFKFKNHWGQWGQNGYGFMPYAYALNPSLAGDFWVVTKVSNGGNPVPPNPPTPPSPIVAQIDAFFANLEARFAGHPLIIHFLKMANQMIDQWLGAQPPAGLTALPPGLKDIIDQVLASLIASATNPFIRIALTVVKTIVDSFLSQATTQHLAKVMASTTPIPANLEVDLQAIVDAATQLAVDDGGLATAQGSIANLQAAVNTDTATLGTAKAKFEADLAAYLGS